MTRDPCGALQKDERSGNVRGLCTTRGRAAILCESGLIRAQHLSVYSPRQIASAATRTNLRAAEQKTIEAGMRECGGSKSKASRRLGLSRTQLYGRLKRYGLDQPSDADSLYEGANRAAIY